MTILFLFVALFALMFIGVPVAVSLGLAGSLTIMIFSQDSVRSLAIKLFETSEHYTLLAIPFFLLAGAFMTTGGVARRLIDFANACVGHIRGGLAIGAVLACMLFAALSGSSPATVAAVGSIAIAGMVRSGYPQAFGAGIVSDYIFRGVTQSNHNPSVTAYFEPRYNVNKDLQLYIGTSTESISFANRAAAEVDVYGGIRPTFGAFAFDIGVWEIGRAHV